jgi:hypothetical protein
MLWACTFYRSTKERVVKRLRNFTRFGQMASSADEDEEEKPRMVIVIRGDQGRV